MKKFKKFLEIEKLRRLFTEIGITQGYLDGEFTKLTKLECIGNKNYYSPGSKVKILWRIEYENLPKKNMSNTESIEESYVDEYEDNGYILTLPGYDCDDIFLSGIVHIPNPSGEEKCNLDAEWMTLLELQRNPFAKKIIIGEE